MSRNRVIYQNQTLYVARNTGIWSLPYALPRVQSIDFDTSAPLTDVNQYGELAAIDRVLLDTPEVNFNFSYFSNCFYPERRMGFYVDGPSPYYFNSGQRSFISRFIDKTQDEKSYWLLTTKEGVDANGAYSNDDPTGDLRLFSGYYVLGLGNGVITSYRAEASVGNFPTVNVGINFLNATVNTGTVRIAGQTAFFSGKYPTINPFNGSLLADDYASINTANNDWDSFSQTVAGSAGRYGGYEVSVIRPGDITVSIISSTDSTVFGTTEAVPVWAGSAVQSYQINADLSRVSQQQLGAKFATSRDIQFPLPITATVDILVGEMGVGGISGSHLANDINTNDLYDVTILMKHPNIESGASGYAIRYDLRGCNFNGYTMNSSIGPAKTASFNFSTQHSTAFSLFNGAKSKGLFLSGNF